MEENEEEEINGQEEGYSHEDEVVEGEGEHPKKRVAAGSGKTRKHVTFVLLGFYREESARKGEEGEEKGSEGQDGEEDPLKPHRGLVLGGQKLPQEAQPHPNAFPFLIEGDGGFEDGEKHRKGAKKGQ